MAEKKEYKTGTKRFYVDKNGNKRLRKDVDRKNMEFKRETYRQIAIRIRRDDTEILEKLDGVENKTEYILELIRKDIKASK